MNLHKDLIDPKSVGGLKFDDKPYKIQKIFDGQTGLICVIEWHPREEGEG